MTAAPKITLDTNCLINLFDSSSLTATSVDELEAIIRFAMAQQADLAVTTRVESDLLKDKDEGRRTELLGRLRLFPVVGTVFRLDHSKLDGGDMLSGPDMARVSEEVRQIVFPALSPASGRYGNKINDIDHLVGHYLNSRDVFVTDDTDILKRRDALRISPGIVVMSPKQCAAYLDKLADLATRVAVPLDGTSAAYRSSPQEGVVVFDYSNNDGRFQIGEGIFAFETAWSKASQESIHAYDHAPSIRRIALLRGRDIAELGEVSGLDYSSRTRTPRIGDGVIWQNTNGLMAATVVKDIKDDTRGDDRDEVTFAYRILADGSSNFG